MIVDENNLYVDESPVISKNSPIVDESPVINKNFPYIKNYDFHSKLQALLAVIRREWTIYVRYPSWVVALLIWPVLFPIGYIFNGKAFAGPDQSGVAVFASLTGTTNYIGFMALGTLLYMWINWVLWSFGAFLRNEQIRGTLESNWLSPMPRILLLAGAGVTSFIQQSLILAISLFEFYLIFGIKIVGNPVQVLLVFIFTVPTIYGLGLLFASLVIWAKEVNVMVFLVRGIIMIFCGISFPLAVMPDWMQVVAKFVPMTYAIRAFRVSYLTNQGFGAIKSDLIILGTFGAILIILGFIAFQRTETFVRKKGTLGVY